MLNDWHISHDFAFNFGGAERVTSAMSRMLPKADVSILAGDDAVIERMQPVGEAKVLYRRLTHQNYRYGSLVLPKLLGRRPPIAGNLLASSYAFAHMLPCEGSLVVYCHSPLRQIWSGSGLYRNEIPASLRWTWGPAVAHLRALDFEASRRANLYIATSRAVLDRLHRFYGRIDAQIVPPPVDSRFFCFDPRIQRQGYYLWAGRIVEPYKRLGLVLEAFTELSSERLVVVGDGRDRQRLEEAAPANVQFVGETDSETLANWYRGAKALVFPSEDDFGMTAVESMACGTPVVAIAAGGPLDTVTPDNGLLFEEPTVRALTNALRVMGNQNWDHLGVSRSVQHRDVAHFESAVVGLVDAVR